jgi:insertion element IS1 protein InsB
VGSYVGKKKEPRWLWHAIDHQTGKVVASVVGRRKEEGLQELKPLRAPFGIERLYTAQWGAYVRQLERVRHCPGKGRTQRIERKHLTLRTRLTRLARKTLCFSKSVQRHDLVIGLFVNQHEFGLRV